MLQPSHKVREKEWEVKYVRRRFGFKNNCPTCGLKTREWVYHVVTDYFNEDGSPHPTYLRSPWHHVCHDQRCQHDLCVEQRKRRFIKMVFGDYVVEIVLALGDMIKTADVPEFLSSPHRELNGLSPLRMIWEHDEWGFERVMRIIEGIASGAFV